MKGLIIGAGYVGCAFLRLHDPNKGSWTATTTTEPRLQVLQRLGGRAELFSLSDAAALGQLIDDVDVICLFIAPKDYNYQIYTQMSQALAELSCLQNKKRLILYTSSTFVYKGIVSLQADESLPLFPAHPKAKLLLEAEMGLMSLQSSLIDVCILRLGGIYGPGREIERRVQHLSGRLISARGDVPTNHIHVDDVAHFIHYCIEKRLTGIYNVVHSEHPLRQDLYERIAHKIGVSPPIFSTEDKSEHGCDVVVSNQKLRETGYRLRHPGWE